MKINCMMKCRQRGFSLLETMLAIGVITAVSVGVVWMYLSAKANSDLQKTEEIAQQVASAAQQYLSSSYDPADTVSTDELVNGGLLPAGIVVTSAGGAKEIRGPFGSFTVDSVEGGEKQQFYVVANDLPTKQAVDYCQHMFSNFAVFNGTTPNAAIASLNECATKITANGDRSNVTIGSPKSASWTSV